ncbi:LysR family transcriptional regulator [Fischerella sp. PCC 9605]|uniref:LysR family transcriptional regulator n=1 Tax=Fischerella sp. PCC 9605 TaxID=1173024 RepID=UPI0007C5043F|nr:LysR family transcriptional regulator [Fischerella sp. PCC 9605]
MIARSAINFRHLSKFELRQICYFMEIVDAEHSFSEASKRLNIEQPALSQRIKSLETVLGVKLFNRRRRPPELTEAGKVFLQQAQLGLTYIDRAITQAQRASRGEIGHLAVGIGSIIANGILPDVLRQFTKHFPDVELELRELTVEQEIQQLREHRLDMGFESIPSPYEQDTSLSFEPIIQEPFVIALPQTHPLATQTQIPLTALENEPFILPSLDVMPFYKKVLTLCEQAGFQPKIQNVQATWTMTILSLVASELGVAILPSNIQNLQRQGVVYRAIQNANLTRQIAVVWQRDNSSTALHNFLKVIKDVTQQSEFRSHS